MSFLAAAALVFGALWASDDTNAQIGVPPLSLLVLFTLVPAELRLGAGMGIVAGMIGYAIFFVRQRGRRVPMPDYGGEPALPAEGDAAARASAEPAARATPSTPDGPYYIPGTPRKTRLAADGTPGEPMRFEGRVRYADGRPVAGALIEIWHADGNGDYDNADWNCRGHQATAPDGSFAFDTVRPFGYGKRSLSMAGVVDYRSAHLHVKIRRDGGTFTSQLWFPDDDERNPTDIAYGRFQETNVLALDRSGETLVSRFDFVLQKRRRAQIRPS